MRPFPFVRFLSILGILFLVAQPTTSSATPPLPKDAPQWPAQCEAGNGDACVQHALRLLYGDAITADQRAAYTYFEKGCALGQTAACGWKGEFDFFGYGGAQKNESAGFALMNQACKKGQPRPCTKIGILLDRGNPGKLAPNRAAATPYITYGCTNGDTQACAHIGLWNSDKVAGLAQMDNACEAGSNDGCHFAGWARLHGVGYAKNLERGWAQLEMACTKYDNLTACGMRAESMLNNGREEAALAEFARMCGDQILNACKAAGSHHALATRYGEAKELYGKACAMGDQPSCEYIRDLDQYLADVKARNDRIAAEAAREAASRAEGEKAMNDYLAAGNYRMAYGLAVAYDMPASVLADLVNRAFNKRQLSTLDMADLDATQYRLGVAGYDNERELVKTERLRRIEEEKRMARNSYSTGMGSYSVYSPPVQWPSYTVPTNTNQYRPISNSQAAAGARAGSGSACSVSYEFC